MAPPRPACRRPRVYMLNKSPMPVRVLVDPTSGLEVAAENPFPAELLVRSPKVMIGYKGMEFPAETGG
ncbi:hypothetical protein PG993_008803 [Apiospora rasikravindrae]|uniref:Uncharacterized protein n=1 Tax=Apiospora rasikravindrae TaxID=990691 RepID=A0ABR1SPE6_9PEZI